MRRDLIPFIWGMATLRNEELILRERLLDATGINKNKLYVSIKGDSSLHETAFFKERYESVVDQFQARLIPNLKEIIIRHPSPECA